MRSKGTKWRKAKDELIWAELVKRTVTWILEARPIVRVVVRTEPEVGKWARNKGPNFSCIQIFIVHKIRRLSPKT
jgi:hypothetical protein